MAVKQSVNWLNQMRVDIPDLRSIESGVIFDFKTMIQCFVGNTPYILRGFTIPVSGISGPATSLQLVVDSAVAWIPGDTNGSFLRVNSGTSNEILSPANTKVIGSFSPGANYVSIRFNRATDSTTNDLVSIWDVDSDSEFTKTAPRGLVMDYQIVIDGSTFGNNAPVAIVNVSGSNVTSILNAKESPFRLATGGASPNISYEHTYSVMPENPLLATSNSSPDPFTGGDWELTDFKDWMDAVMTQFKKLLGGAFWYTGSLVPGINITDLFFDTLGSKLTGRGAFRHSSTTPGELTWTSDLNLRSIFGNLTLVVSADTVQLADQEVAYVSLVRNQDFQPANTFTFTNGSTTVTGTLPVAGITSGDWIKFESHDMSKWAKVASVASNTITLSSAYTGASTSGKALRTQGTYTALVAAPGSVPVSGNTYWLAKRDDNAFSTLTIAAPASSGLIRALDIATATTTTPHGLVEGQAIAVAGTNISSFSGFFDVLAVNTATEFTYYNPGADIGAGVAGSGTITATPRIYLHLTGGGGSELEQGEEVQIDDETTLNILRFIGAESETDITPPYTIFPNSLSPYDFTSNDNLTEAISKITGNVNALYSVLDLPAYDEPLVVISGSPSGSNEVTGPIASGTTLTLPFNSRLGPSVVTNYTVGKGYLEVFLNGQLLQLTSSPYSIGLGWTEVGASLTDSNQIVINQGLEIGDVLTFRIDGPGGPGGAGSSAPDDDFHNLPSSVTPDNADEIPIWDTSLGVYRKQTRSIFLSGVSNLLLVNTYSANHTADSNTDGLIRMDATAATRTVTLPDAATCQGKVFYIKKVAGGNNVVIDTTSSQLIDGSLTQTIVSLYDTYAVVSNATGWDVI